MVEYQIRFEFAALFHSPNSRVKKRGNFKPNLFFDQMESFLYCLALGFSSGSKVSRMEHDLTNSKCKDWSPKWCQYSTLFHSYLMNGYLTACGSWLKLAVYRSRQKYQHKALYNIDETLFSHLEWTRLKVNSVLDREPKNYSNFSSFSNFADLV